MKSVLFAAIVLLSSASFASIMRPIKAFDIDMNLSINGKQISTPRVVVKEGEKATFTQEVDGEQNVIEVVAKEIRKADFTKVIKMEFTVSRIAADGTTTVISKPKIIAAPNAEALIQVGESGRPEALSLSVVANKITF